MEFAATIVNDITRMLVRVSEFLLTLYHNKDFTVSFKEDGTEVTSADLLCQNLLVDGLQDIFGHDVSIISEECSQQNNEAKRRGGKYFLIDPIDGTYNFIHNGDFCVNLTYILNGVVVFGAIAAPQTSNIYYTVSGKSFRYNWRSGDSKHLCLQDSSRITDRNMCLVISGGRSITQQEDIMHAIALNLLKHGYKISDYILYNAAIKYCEMLEGRADMLINPIQAMDWDIASGCAILQNAGYFVCDPLGAAHGFSDSSGICNGVIAVRDKSILEALTTS